MSNNKQIMKLYTEEQMRKALRAYFDLSKFLTESDIIKEFTLFELPSDEEIYKEAKRYENYTTDMDELSALQSSSRYYGFMEGAAYVINKIQGGNK